MKLEITRVALLSAFALTNPLFVLAGGQSDNSQTPADQTQYQSAQAQYSDSTPQAVQQGKDTGGCTIRRVPSHGGGPDRNTSRTTLCPVR